MLGFISKLQRKPEAMRRRIALIASASITGLIVIFWLVSLFVGDSPEPIVTKKKDETGPMQAMSEGLGAFMDDTKEVFKEAAGLFAAFKDIDEESEEATSTVSE